MVEFLALLQQITAKFSELYDLPPDNQPTSTVGQSNARSFLKEAKTTLEYDPSGLTSISHLEQNWQSCQHNYHFSLFELLNSDTGLLKTQKLGSELNTLFNDEEYQSEKKYFADVVEMGLKHYGSEAEFSVAEMMDARFSCLNSYKKIGAYQFLDGPFDSKHPSYVKQVYEWWNINSLLKFAVTLPNSVSLHLIRNPNLFETYFCFVVKNGANVYLLTDKKETNNPLYYSRTRRPDRDMARKIGEHRFPYYLLDLEAEDGELYELEAEDLGNTLVPFQKETTILTTIDQLERPSLLWTILMFNLIEQNYFLNQVRLDEISLTAELIHKPESLIEHAAKYGLSVHTTPHAFKKNTVSSVHSSNVDAEALGGRIASNWMEERYGHLVTEDSLNIVGVVDSKFELDVDTGSLVALKQSQSDNRENVQLSNTVVSDFGTAQQLHNDHIFIARHNYAQIVSDCAKKEFEREKDAMNKWFCKMVDKSFDRILDACRSVKPHYHLVKQDGELTYARTDRDSKIIFNGLNLSRMSLIGPKLEVTKNFLSWFPQAVVGKAQDRSGNSTCCISGKTGTFGIGFRFNDIDDVVDFFGIEISDVPEFLQFYGKYRRNKWDNSITGRVDPLAVVPDPFYNYRLSFIVVFSKSELKKLV